MTKLLPPTIADERIDSFWLTGCLTPQHAYQVSPLSEGIFLNVENLSGSHEVLLELADHPGTWPANDLTAVRLLVRHHGRHLLGSNSQISILDIFQSLTHLPLSMVDSEEAVMAVERWLCPCPYEPLKNFVYQVLGQPSIGCPFFTYPASTHYHHCASGGLAQHSLEVAQTVYGMTACFPEHERWLAAVAGLLHDLGKVRSFLPDGRRTSTGFLVSHELLGFELLVPALRRLEDSWADGANALRNMFDWIIRPKQQRPLMPVAMSIQQADMMSASADNRQRTFNSKPDWYNFAKFDGPGPSSSYWLPSPP